MSQQKKAIIILVVIAVVFIGFIISGAILDRGDRPSTDQSNTEDYRDTAWGDFFEKPMAWFTPSLSPKSIHHVSTNEYKITFSIDGDEDHAFRSLKVMVNRPTKWNSNSQVSVIYEAPTSSDENLKTQEPKYPLEVGSANRKSSTTFAVLKSKGTLNITLNTPAQLRMKDGKNTIVLCERMANGTVRIGNGF